MAAGKYRHPVTIGALTETRSPSGAVKHNWAVVAKKWALVEGISGREWVSAGVETSTTTYRVTMRAASGIDETMRIRQGDLLLDIKAVLPDPVNRELVLMCAQVSDDG